MWYVTSCPMKDMTTPSTTHLNVPPSRNMSTTPCQQRSLPHLVPAEQAGKHAQHHLSPLSQLRGPAPGFPRSICKIQISCFKTIKRNLVSLNMVFYKYICHMTCFMIKCPLTLMGVLAPRVCASLTWSLCNLHATAKGSALTPIGPKNHTI